MSNDPHIHIDHDDGASRPNVFVRVALIIGILIILFLIAVAIVRFVPKFISSLTPANVSLTSLFDGNATSTPANTDPNAQNSQYQQNQSVYNNASSTGQYNQNNNTNATGNTNTIDTGARRTNTSPVYTYTQPSYTYQTGPADLAISLVKVGRVLPSGAFQQTSNLTAGDRVSLQFTVANVGSGRSGNWTLSARLPTQIPAEQNYVSVVQPSIAPGSSYLMTMAFDAFDPSQSSIQVVINASDANTSNNTLVVNVTGTGTSYNYNNYNNTNYGNSACYYSNGGYICPSNNYNYGNYNYSYNNNTTNGCYWNNGTYYCSNTNYNTNNNCYYMNGSYICNNNNTSYNYPDISIRIISTGVVNRSTNQFTSTNTITRNDRAAVQVEVRNNGNTGTGQWNFTGTLSGSGSSSSYSSGTQSDLPAGASQVYVATFDNPTAGQQTISLQANLSSNNYESNTSNNYASQGVYISN